MSDSQLYPLNLCYRVIELFLFLYLQFVVVAIFHKVIKRKLKVLSRQTNNVASYTLYGCASGPACNFLDLGSLEIMLKALYDRKCLCSLK